MISRIFCVNLERFNEKDLFAVWATSILLIFCQDEALVNQVGTEYSIDKGQKNVLVNDGIMYQFSKFFTKSVDG